MAGIPSAEGSGDDDRNPGWLLERYPPHSTSVRQFLSVFNYDMDLVAKMLSGLSHLPIDEKIDALRKKSEEFLRSKASSVHTSNDEDDEDEQDEDEMDEDEEKDMEGETLKLVDDEKKPRRAEEHQVHSECQGEWKKPRLAECIEKPEARETNNRNDPFTRQ